MVINPKKDFIFKRHYLMYRLCGKLQRRYFFTKHFERKFYNAIIELDTIIIRKRMIRF